jgi:hypothetical protein
MLPVHLHFVYILCLPYYVVCSSVGADRTNVWDYVDTVIIGCGGVWSEMGVGGGQIDFSVTVIFY